MATKLEDTELLARIAGGYLVAIEAKYHNRYLTNYNNRYRSMERKTKFESSDNSTEILESHVYAELVS